MKKSPMVYKLMCLLLALTFSGCSKPGGNSPEPCGPPEEPISLVEFTFTESGSSIDSIYSYTAERTAEGTHIYIELNCGQNIIDVTVEENVLRELGQTAARCGMDKWDGFDKNNKNVLDGKTFSLYMTTEDGQSISACGSNNFPPNYTDACWAINETFRRLIEEYGDLYPKTLESDELNYFFLTIREDSGKVLSVSSYREEQDKYRIDVHVKGYPELFPEEYFFYGYSDTFPFEKLQAVVRKYDIPAWNGWDRTDEEGTEWFQMSLGYASEENISAIGSLHPENYDAASGEFAEILLGFLRENNERFILFEG